MKKGTRAGQAYVELTIDGDGLNEEIVSNVEESEEPIGESGERSGKNWRERFSKEALGEKFDEIRDRAGEKLRETLGTAGEDAGKDFGKNFGDNVDSDFFERIGDRAGESFASKFLTSLEDKLGGDGEGPLHDLFEKLTSGGGVSRNRGKQDDFATRIGDLLGSGSRNNALNAFGKSITGIVNLVSGGVNAVQSFFSAFSKGFSEAEEGASLFAKIGAGGGEAVSQGLTSLASSGPAAAAALGIVAVSMVVLVSVANALLAILVALASVIASALVAALGVAAAGLTALVAVAGLAVLAFKSMTDAQKTLLKDAFQPLHAEAVGLGQDILKDLVPAFKAWSDNLQVALAIAKPLADVMGGALAEAGKIFTASLSGPGVQRFITVLSQELMPLLTQLASALGGFLNGSLGLFAGILPFVTQFAQYLNQLATRFSDFVNSAKGQNSIRDFMERAVDSAKSLIHFIGAVGGLISELLFSSSSQSAGENIFDRMTKAVKKFTDYISKDDRLDKWLKSGERFAVALGDAIVTISKLLQKLNNSGVIDGLAAIAEDGASVYAFFDGLPRVLQDIVNPLLGVSDALSGVVKLIQVITGSQGGTGSFLDDLNSTIAGAVSTAQNSGAPSGVTSPAAATGSLNATTQGLIDAGNTALSQTTSGSGPKTPAGTLTAAQLAQYQAMADAIIKNGPTLAAQIKQALTNVHKTITNALVTSNKDFANAINTASHGTDSGSVITALQNLVESQAASVKNTISTLNANAKNLVTSAQSSLNSAAEQLANATTQKEADAALRAIKAAQKQLKQAKAAQKDINAQTAALAASVKAGNAIIKAQAILSEPNVEALTNGFKVVNATLADYAEARGRVADLLQDANTKLQAAIATRDNYAAAVSGAVEAFGAITTAQAKTIDGVQQALTANDITTNLQSKLDQIKDFQTNLNILLAQGLSQDAYKQLVDAGVEQGGAYAKALVAGGQGAVQQVNSLTGRIKDVATQLGGQSSSILYQAGVDAAQGLVDGLTSLSAELDAAATALGDSIARAVKRALGIASPSRVMIDAMGSVGDGVIVGLDGQHDRVGLAADRFAKAIAVSPEVAAYAAQNGGTGYRDADGTVSGNRRAEFAEGAIQITTTTDDPEAVAHEVFNEITGRL